MKQNLSYIQFKTTQIILNTTYLLQREDLQIVLMGLILLL